LELQYCETGSLLVSAFNEDNFTTHISWSYGCTWKCSEKLDTIQGVSKPMSQTFPGYSPPQNKQKSSYQHGSKSEQVPRYRLTFMCWYPFEYHIRCSKCWPFAATHSLRRRIMDYLTRSSWPGRFLVASNVATIRSHNSSTLASRMACGFACGQICTLWKLKIPSRVNIASAVNNSFHRNCGCRKLCFKHHWQNLTRRDKSSGLRPCTRYRWYGYSRSSCSIFQRILTFIPSAEDILRVLVPGLAATWARSRCSCCTVLAVRGLPPSITGMNVPFSRRRCAMRENVQLHGSRRFGNVSWYRRLASCALPLARP